MKFTVLMLLTTSVFAHTWEKDGSWFVVCDKSNDKAFLKEGHYLIAKNMSEAKKLEQQVCRQNKARNFKLTKVKTKI